MCHPIAYLRTGTTKTFKANANKYKTSFSSTNVNNLASGIDGINQFNLHDDVSVSDVHLRPDVHRRFNSSHGHILTRWPLPLKSTRILRTTFTIPSVRFILIEAAITSLLRPIFEHRIGR